IRLPQALEGLAAECQRMLRAALDASAQGDAARAERLLPEDEAVDDRRDGVVRAALAEIRAPPELSAESVGLILVAKHLERVADHATNVAESVILLVEGRNVRHADKLAAAE